MRKILLLGFLGVFLVASLVISKPAQSVDLSITGFAQVETYMLGNYTFNNSGPLADKGKGFTDSFLNERMRLDFNLGVTKDLAGVLKLELDSTNFGDNGDGRNNVGKLNADRAGLEIRNAYIDANLPYVPVNLKAGVYGFYYRPHIFLYTDASGFEFNVKLPPVTITPFYYKGYEGALDKNDDINFYGAIADYTSQNLRLGVYGLYVPIGDFQAATRPAFSYPYPGRYAPFNVKQNGDFYWAGVYSDGGTGKLLYRFDALTNWGKLKDRTTATSKDIDYFGWAAYGKVWLDYKFFQVGLVGMYSSGDDLKKTNDLKGFRLPPGSEAYAIFSEGLIFYPSSINPVDGYMTFSLDSANNAYNYQPYRGFGGTYLAKFFATYNPFTWLTLTGQYSYIGDTVKNGNRFGSAKDEDFIGHEVDLLGRLTITKNLAYDFGLGYLFAGDALKKNDATKTEDAWAVITRLLLTF